MLQLDCGLRSIWTPSLMGQTPEQILWLLALALCALHALPHHPPALSGAEPAQLPSQLHLLSSMSHHPQGRPAGSTQVFIIHICIRYKDMPRYARDSLLAFHTLLRLCTPPKHYHVTSRHEQSTLNRVSKGVFEICNKHSCMYSNKTDCKT